MDINIGKIYNKLSKCIDNRHDFETLSHTDYDEEAVIVKWCDICGTIQTETIQYGKNIYLELDESDLLEEAKKCLKR